MYTHAHTHTHARTHTSLNLIIYSLRVFVHMGILCFMMAAAVSSKSKWIWWGISLRHRFTQTCQGQVTVGGLSPAPSGRSHTSRVCRRRAHLITCSDGLCGANNAPFNLLNDYHHKKTNGLTVTVGLWEIFVSISGLRIYLGAKHGSAKVWL